MTDLSENRDRLLNLLRGMQRVAVAFSGGVDSTVVASAAQKSLGENAIAITGDSPSVARSELQDAITLANQIGIRHQVIRTDEFASEAYLANDGSRCYHCKSELYDQILARLSELEVEVICSGANLDDQGDYRPGLIAAGERAVRHPLQEAGFSKAMVRDLAREWGLPNWNKPASPCLSSRIAPGVQVTIERTSRIERAEALLRSLGFSDCRVRLHEGELARIELSLSEMSRLLDPTRMQMLSNSLREFGFRFVTIDLEGLRSGSLNQLVPLEIRRRFPTREG
jgi:uncharacterized protein